MTQTQGVGASNPQIFWSATGFDQGGPKNNPADKPSLVSVQAKQPTQAQAPKTAEALPRTVLNQDSIQKVDSPYQTLNHSVSPLPPAQTPMLTPATGDIRLADQFNLADHFKALADSYPKTAPTPDKTYFNQLDEQLGLIGDTVYQKQMGQLAEQKGKSLFQIHGEVRFAAHHPEVNVDPEIRQIVQQASEQVTLKTQKEFGLGVNWKPSKEAVKYQAAVQDGLLSFLKQGSLLLDAKQITDPKASKDKVLFALEHPELANQLDGDIVATAKQLEAKGQTTANVIFGAPQEWKAEGWESLKGDLQSALNNPAVKATYIKTFEEHINQLLEQGVLSIGDANLIRAQFYQPESSAPLTETLKTTKNRAVEKAQSKIQQQYQIGLPPTEPKLTTNDVKVSATYVETFEASIQESIDQGKLTKGEANQLRAQFYNPKDNIPLKEDFVAIKNEAMSRAQTQIQTQYGAPADYTPTLPKFDYEQVAKVAIDDTFTDLVQSGGYGLTASEQKQLISVLHGEVPANSIQGDLSLTLAKITKQTLDTVNTEFGVNYTTLPNVSVELNPTINQQGLKAAKSAIKVSQEFVQGKIQHYDYTMPPDDPNRVVVLDAMKVISAALSRLSTVLEESAIANTSASQRISKGQMDIQLNKLDKQRIQLQEQQDSAEKQQDMAWMGPVMDTILMITAVLAAPFTGGLSLVIATTFVIVNNTVGVGEAINEMVTLMSNTFDLPPILVKLVVVTALLIAASFAGGMVFLDIGMQILMESQILQDIGAVMGMDAMDQQIFAMVIMILIMIVICIAMLFIPGVGEAVIADIAVNTTVNMVGRIVKMIVDIIMMVVKMLMEVLRPIINVLKAVAKVVLEAIKMVIKTMQTLLKRLLQAATKTADEAVDIASDATRAASTLAKPASKLETALNKAISSLDDLVKSLDDAARGLEDTGKSAIKSADDATDSSFMSKVKDSFKEMKEGLKSDLDDAIKEASNSTKLKEELNSLNETIESASKFIDKVADFFKGGAKSTDDITKATVKSSDDLGDTLVDASKQIATKGEDTAESLAKKSDDMTRAGSSTSRAATNRTKQFQDFMKRQLDKLDEYIQKQLDDLELFFETTGKKLDPSKLQEKIKTAITGTGKKTEVVETKVSQTGFEDTTSLLDGLDAAARKAGKAVKDEWRATKKSIDDSIQSTKDSFHDAAEVLKNDPYKWGDALKAFKKGSPSDPMDDMMMMLEVFANVVQMASSAQQFFTALDQADMVKRIAQLEADIKRMDAIISIMKAVNDSLMKDTDLITKHLESVQQLQSQKWSQLSRMMTKLVSANTAKQV